MGWLIGLIVGIVIGWIVAHGVVASECRRLGSFYVGDTVFKCVAIMKRERDQ